MLGPVYMVRRRESGRSQGKGQAMASGKGIVQDGFGRVILLDFDRLVTAHAQWRVWQGCHGRISLRCFNSTLV